MWRSRQQRRRLSTLVRPVNLSDWHCCGAFGSSASAALRSSRRPCVLRWARPYDGQEAQADAAIGHLDGFIHALEKLEEQERFDNGEVVLKEPIGVCGLITPWNWPINQVVLKVLPVIATGCTCVLKPSEHTPVSAMLYAEILDEAGYQRASSI
ncbi:MAG: hypothetical protein CM15mP84_05080 [Cellvibrionales bacterium]|nr:MAG: hypothetical protein CM15mP84_05080 [Cellvibrionales bacterium]